MPKSPIITHKEKTMFNGNIPKSNCHNSKLIYYINAT